MEFAAVEVGDALDRAREVNDGSAGEDLAGAGLGADQGREVHGVAAVPSVDLHGLPYVEPDPDGQRKVRSRLRPLETAALNLDRRADRLAR